MTTSRYSLGTTKVPSLATLQSFISANRSAASLSWAVASMAPKALWVGDNAAPGEVKPLVEVDKAWFLVGSKIPGVMTANSKVAYGGEDAAKAAQAAQGGEIVRFDQALLLAYTDMSKDVSRIRKNRAERRKKMMMEHKG